MLLLLHIQISCFGVYINMQTHVVLYMNSNASMLYPCKSFFGLAQSLIGLYQSIITTSQRPAVIVGRFQKCSGEWGTDFLSLESGYKYRSYDTVDIQLSINITEPFRCTKILLRVHTVVLCK